MAIEQIMKNASNIINIYDIYLNYIMYTLNVPFNKYVTNYVYNEYGCRDYSTVWKK